MSKMFHKINPQKIEVKEPKKKSDHKPISPSKAISNLPSDTLSSKALNLIKTTSELRCFMLKEIRDNPEHNKKKKQKHEKPVHPN